MTSPCDQRNKHHQPAAILFFKAIVRQSLAVGRLKIPNSFARKCGGGLSNPVFLKPPDSTKWKVNWTKHGGEIWFKKGWKEFTRYYSLDHGHLVVFKYEGTSHFDVHIFDNSDVEIDYTLQHVTNDDQNEDSVEIVDEKSPCQKTRLKSTMSSHRPHKKMKTCKIRDVERSSNPQNLHQHDQTEGNKSEGTNSEMAVIASVKQELDEDHVGGGIFRTECPKVETKTTAASITVTTFRSKNPFFILVTKHSHVEGYASTIPLQFGEKYLKKTKGIVLLEALDGRTWSVIYNAPKLAAGWNKFASDNNLNVGDVCVFELTKKEESISFKVFIFPVPEQPSCPLSRGKNASQTIPLFISPCLGMIRSLKEAGNFSSENPIFIVNMKRSYIKKTGPNVPCLFIRRYIGKEKRTLIIQFGRRLWPVNFLYYGYKASGKLSCGWCLFAEESKLQVGDVCIFELINRENVVLGVHVFRGHI